MRIIIGLLLLVIISLGTTSCQKEFKLDAVDSSLITRPPSSVSGSFTATIDGVKFVADKMTGAECDKPGKLGSRIGRNYIH